MISREMARREGWKGWDEYAPFYDWENARTLGRKDVPFWRQVAAKEKGPVLELGCGTGRIALPLARAGVALVGIDRSERMLERTARRLRALPRRQPGRRRRRLTLVRGDIRALPFADGHFNVVLAPYGILQSLLRDRDLNATLESVARVLRSGGLFGLDLVPDVPNWREYTNSIQLRGKATGGTYLTLVESVRQDRKRRLTTFQQTYLERRRGRVNEHRFDLTFRTLPVRLMTRRLERAGFKVEAILGDYRGGPWDDRAEVWIMLARRCGRSAV
ncbi:MAG: methyltransferase domain-containing protein [Luteitalea sp.]|nr:methyltransferase domain-containing protein [Luteitalea sp.]